jgi:sugar lactone lactonase YvrE
MIRYIIAGCLICFTACKKDNGFTHSSSSPMSVDHFTPEQGGGGTSILITGSNFSTDTAAITVTINGNKLAIIGASATQVMAVVPARCGSGNVVVKVGSDSAVSVDMFNYVFTRTVSTLAGNGTAGFANGQGTDAMFDFSGQAWYRSKGIAVDDHLNLYIADPGNHCIRKIDSAGNVTTFAGNPNVSGYADGQGLAAQFSLPYDIAIDAQGYLYTVDPGNFDVRKIAPDGTATIMAWASQEPWNIAVDPTTGFVYYSSATASGNVYKVNDDGTSTAIITGLNNPAGMSFDKQGNLYIVISGLNIVQRFEKGSWVASTIAGQSGVAGFENGASAKFSSPWGLTIDGSSNLYVAGNGTWDGGTYNVDQSIRFIAGGSWVVSTYAGSGSAGYSDAIGEAAAFSAPVGVTVDKNGVVYVLDKNNNRVRKIVSQ